MTLIELMVVVAIIGISLLAFTPSFIIAMADRRAAAGTMELVRLGRRARAEAIGTQRAMLVHIEYGRTAGTARMRLLRGNVMRCDAENWAARVAECPASVELERAMGGCLESIDLSNSHWYHQPFAVTVGMWMDNENPTSTPPRTVVDRVARGGRGDISICYEPSSMVRWAASVPGDGAAMGFSTLNAGVAAGGGLMFAVGIYDRNLLERVGEARVVLYPLAGTPRRLR